MVTLTNKTMETDKNQGEPLCTTCVFQSTILSTVMKTDIICEMIGRLLGYWKDL